MYIVQLKLSCCKGLCNNVGASVPFSSKDFNYGHPMPSPTELLLLVRAHLPMLTCLSIDRGLQKCDRLVLLAIYNPYFLQIGDEDWIAKITPNLTGIINQYNLQLLVQGDLMFQPCREILNLDWLMDQTGIKIMFIIWE